MAQRRHRPAPHRPAHRPPFAPGLTALQLERFYADLLQGGGAKGIDLTSKTVRNTHVVLRKALADAERLGLVPRNVASSAGAPVGRQARVLDVVV